MPQRDGAEGTVDRLNEAPQDYLLELALSFCIPAELLDCEETNYSSVRQDYLALREGQPPRGE